MGNVTLDEHWTAWMDKLVKKRVRLSRAEIVRDGLKAIKFSLDHELDEVEAIEATRKEMREEGEGE